MCNMYTVCNVNCIPLPKSHQSTLEKTEISGKSFSSSCLESAQSCPRIEKFNFMRDLEGG